MPRWTPPDETSVAGIDDSPLAAAADSRRADATALVAQALQDKRFALAFQPVVHAGNPAQPAFYEGLIRIFDPQDRIIPARDFITQVETLELGRQIDCAAMTQGIAELRKTPGLRLAINMSARSIGYPEWKRILDAGLADDPTLGERLILEITEESAMTMPELVSVFMRDMQKRGIAFALDDFGAGFTSFRYLRDFYFDILKIDGQFVRGIAENSDNQVLTMALISIGQHFDMVTVAESVETETDARALKNMGIDCLQGYLFGAPILSKPWQRKARNRRRA